MLIKVKVSVESKKDQIIKKSDDSYLVSVKEKAERGQANQKVKEILALYFKIASKKIKLVKGGKKPGKIFEILEQSSVFQKEYSEVGLVSRLDQSLVRC